MQVAHTPLWIKLFYVRLQIYKDKMIIILYNIALEVMTNVYYRQHQAK